MQMHIPLVSIIIPAYNCARFLRQTLDSVLSQSYERFEVIVVDDGSTDNTSDIVRAYDDPRVKYYYQDNSGGPSKPRNVGMNIAQGELISFFDSDDVMDVHKLARGVAVFNKHPDIDLIFTDFQIIDEDGQLLKERFLADYRSFRKLLQPCFDDDKAFILTGDVYHELIYANFIGTSGVILRQEICRKIGHMDESLVCSEDREYWYRVIRSGATLCFLDYPGHSYRRRADSMTTRSMYIYPSMLRVLERQRVYGINKETAKLIEDKINEILGSYAWIATRMRHYDIAKQSSLQLVRNRAFRAGVTAYLKASLLSMIDNSTRTAHG